MARWQNYVGWGGRLCLGQHLSIKILWQWARFGLGAEFTMWTTSYMLTGQLAFLSWTIEWER